MAHVVIVMFCDYWMFLFQLPRHVAHLNLHVEMEAA